MQVNQVLKVCVYVCVRENVCVLHLSGEKERLNISCIKSTVTGNSENKQGIEMGGMTF